MLSITPLIRKALYFSAEKHDGQYRKGGNVPFVVHPIIVAWGVLSFSDDEEIIAAALLHDVIEDSNVSLAELVELFGERVAKLVGEISYRKSAGATTHIEWRKKKENFIDHVKSASPDALLILAVDKIHNMSSYFDAVSRGDVEVLARFRGSPEDYVWYYDEIGEILKSSLPSSEVVNNYYRILGFYKNKSGL